MAEKTNVGMAVFIPDITSVVSGRVELLPSFLCARLSAAAAISLYSPVLRCYFRALLHFVRPAARPSQDIVSMSTAFMSLKPGVHTNDFAPIHRRRALKLGHASLATVFRPGRLTFQQIPQENLESPLLRYQPITTAVITEACLNTRWHHGAYTPAALRESLGVDRVVV